MLVSEMAAWLLTQDQGATVEILERIPSMNWSGDTFKATDFDPEQHADYYDGDKHEIGKPYENTRTLFLGAN
jgi:hypothetical protein